MEELRAKVQQLGLGSEAEDKLEKLVEKVLKRAEEEVDNLPFYLRFFAGTILDIVKSALFGALKDLQ